VKDRHIVSIKESNRKSYALYRMVALHMTLSAPNHPKPPHFLHFASPFVMGEPRDIKFCTRVGRSAMRSLSLSLVMSECFISGAVRITSAISTLDLENLATASRRYTGDIHNLTVVDLFMTPETMGADSVASWLSAHVYYTLPHCNPPTS